MERDPMERHPDFLDENRISTPPDGLTYPFDPEVYAAHLEHGLEVLGADDPALEVLLRGMQPLEAVQALMAESQISSIGFESKLRKGGWDAISTSDDPAIVAACVLYLASSASAWVTGKDFEVDGGVEAPQFKLPVPSL